VCGRLRVCMCVLVCVTVCTRDGACECARMSLRARSFVCVLPVYLCALRVGLCAQRVCALRVRCV